MLRRWGIHIHDVAKIGSIGITDLPCGKSCIICWIARWILITLIVARMIGVIGWHYSSMTLVSVLLREILLVVVGSWVILIWIISWHIGILSGLWTDSMKTTESWTLLVVIIVVATSVTDRSSPMIGNSIWAQEVISIAIFSYWRMMVLNLDICLSKLI